MTLLDGMDGVEIAFADRDDRADSAHHLAVVAPAPDIDREDVRTSLDRAGIQTSVHYPPIHRFTAYADAHDRGRCRAPTRSLRGSSRSRSTPG